jgi:hypothetical protein
MKDEFDTIMLRAQLVKNELELTRPEKEAVSRLLD